MMAGSTNSKKPINKGTDYTNTQKIMEENIPLQVQELATCKFCQRNRKRSVCGKISLQVQVMIDSYYPKVLREEGCFQSLCKISWMDELPRIVAVDKMKESEVFSVEVIRFGNRSKDPYWHNLDRHLQKLLHVCSTSTSH
ncbi:hypothetical protein Fmac_001149 [Flemingia macrophylla]|uniref:Uncharacterized protein n=1 Tax=Flemingia macrophylla TaxID=520843 RepID=A0ABD1NG94_9FABA